jgi:NADPH-dependent curcumin reductase CurA
MPTNRQWRLAARPTGLPTDSVWQWTESPVTDPAEGDVLARVRYISLDPAMRGWMNDGRSYLPPVPIGDVMRAGGLGEVIDSRHPDFAAGDWVWGMLGVQDYATLTPGGPRGMMKIDPSIKPVTLWLSPLGMVGMTAYFGLLDIGAPKEGETVVVSAAAGAVGSLVGQIAKIKGCRAVGIAGGAEKCRYIVEELGYDAAIDYKSEDVRAALERHCPTGIDVYFDNVGGSILEAVLSNLARKARIALCGAISQYNAGDSAVGPRNYMSLLVNRARMEGFLVMDFGSRFGPAVKEMAGWIAAGKLKSREDIQEGLENFPAVFLKLFRGENDGKLILKT